MFLVHNQTERPVFLGDLRAEIPIGKMIDLERLASEAAINDSGDLRHALKLGILKIIKQTVVKSDKKTAPQVVEKVVEKIVERTVEPSISEDKIAALLKDALAGLTNNNIDKKIEEALTANMANVSNLISSIKDDIKNVSTAQPATPTTVEKKEKPIIDDKKMADLIQKSINQIEIETSPNAQASKKIRIINKSNTKDLASEL